MSVNDNKVDRWQDVRVELLNNIVNKDNINLQLMNSENKKIDYQLKYNSSILNKEGDVVQNIGYGNGTIRPNLWGVKASPEKNKRRK